MGPVVGVVAAAQVDLALALLDGRDVAGQLVTFDGRTERPPPPRRPRACRTAPSAAMRPRIRRIEPETVR